MNLLHTSDWHLGASLAGHDRLAEQELFLEWLLNLSVERRIQALLIAGDIFDTINPPIEAQRLFAWFLVELHQRLPHCTVVAIAGNHDSAGRLETSRPFAEALGRLHLVGSAHTHGSQCLIPLLNAEGQAAAWCLAVPFLRPADIDCKVGVNESPEQAFARSVESFYCDLRDQAVAQNPELPLIAMGHCTVSGVQRAGSERLLIGGVESLPYTTLATGADYVALGHIHRPQTAGAPHIRYSGTPYAMDCDERQQQHQVVVIQLEKAKNPISIETIEVPNRVPMLRFPDPAGDWEATQAQVLAFDWSPWQNKPRDLWPLVELAPQGNGVGIRLREHVEDLCASLPLRLVRAYWQNTQDFAATPHRAPLDLASPRAPEALFLRYYATQFDGQAPDPALLKCFQEAVDAVAVEGP